MERLFEPLNPLNFKDLFTLMWVGSLLIIVGAVVVYSIAQARYRRYPALLALHEWIFWPIMVTWGIVPLLAIIHVPLLLILLIVVPGMGVAAWAAFIRYPPIIAAANDELRRRRFVPPPRRAPGKRRRSR